jgi:hypothetical protein
MKYFVALTLFILTAFVTAQIEHAPTVAQCQADQRLWLSQLEGNDRSKLPEFYVLLDETKEMDACQKVDPPNEQSYYNTGAEMDAEREQRYFHFIQRHNLQDKFIEEDRAGMR